MSPHSVTTIPRNVALGVLAAVVLGGLLIWHAESKVNQVALASSAQPVSVAPAKTATWRPSRTYVGRLDPWISANIGPQFISAYIDTVLVRPGAVVKAGQVLATLDCRNANAMARAVEMEARALDEQQRQLTHESTRVTSMLDGGFVSPNEAEIKSAQSAAKMAELLAEKAKLVGTSLEVNDCILRAPFDGEIATRAMDPGGFVHPGTAIVSVVDRSTIRMTADVPENAFEEVAPNKKVNVHIYATGKDILGAITRRAPAADPGSRTIHVEVDLTDPDKQIPVGTTGELRVDLGKPIDAVEFPLSAATIRDTKATIFVAVGEIARTRTFSFLGEGQGLLYVSPADIAPGTPVITEGRALLNEGERIAPRLEQQPAPEGAVAPSGIPAKPVVAEQKP